MIRRPPRSTPFAFTTVFRSPQVTTSAPMTPLSVQLVVAAVVLSYVLFVAVIAGVTVAAVMLAGVVAVVDDRAELPAWAPESGSPVAVTVLAVPTPDAAKGAVPPVQ